MISMQSCNHASMQRHSHPTITPLAHYPIYLTGDLARWLSDGEIEFLGRLDLQVKIRGFRIELGEIRGQLLKHPEVKEALVLVLEKEPGDKSLCAYLVLKEGAGIDNEPSSSPADFMPGQFKEYLSQTLPVYMIPSYFVPIEHIPLTPNGKIDRNALPAPGIPSIGNITLPGNEIEKKMAGIWSEVLGIEKDRINTDANFFDLGGHSLKASLLTSKIHKELAVKVPMGVVFERNTIRKLSGYVKNKTKTQYTNIEPLEKKKYYALSSAQKRIYFLQQMYADSTAYNISVVCSLEKDMDKHKLEEALKKLVTRHESLRTSFEMVEGEPVQRVHDEVEFEVKFYDISVVEVKVEEAVSSFIRPFDLSQAPLLRVGLIELLNTPTALRGHPRRGTYNSQEGEEDKYILIVDLHHIITDETSNQILLQEFEEVYRGNRLPGLQIRYKDYSEWQNSEPQKEAANKQEEYWLKVFAGEIPVLTLPTDYVRPGMQSFEGSSISFRLGRQERQTLNTLARENESTLFMVLLALFSLLLSKISGQEDIVVGTTIEGRRHEDLRQVIGIFVNFLALRQYPKREKSFLQFLKGVRENTLGAFENQEYPFEDLVGNLLVNRDTARNPLFDVMFEFRSMEQKQEKTNELKAKSYEYDTAESKIDLTLWGIEERETLLFVFQYCTKLFKKSTIQCFIGYFKEIVRYVLEDPERMLADIQIVPEAKKQEILAKYGSSMEEEWYESE